MSLSDVDMDDTTSQRRPMYLLLHFALNQNERLVTFDSYAIAILLKAVKQSLQLATIKFTQTIHSIVVCGMLHEIQRYEYTTRLIRSHREDEGLQNPDNISIRQQSDSTEIDPPR